MSTASKDVAPGVRRSVALLCTLAVLCPAFLLSQPKANIVGGLTFDFGTLYSTLKVKKLITIRNDGSDTLNITDVSTSCGCTAALLSQPAVPPHDSTTLEIAFDPRRFTGAVEKGVSMKTNDPANPKPHMVFTATIAKVIEVEPEYLMFHTTVGRPDTAVLGFSNATAKPVAILSAKSSSPLLVIGPFDKTLEPSQPVTVQCVFTPDHSGAQKGNITFTTDDPNVPVISLRYFALVKDAEPSPASGGNK